MRRSSSRRDHGPILLSRLAWLLLLACPLGATLAAEPPAKTEEQKAEPKLDATIIFAPRHFVDVSITMKPADWSALCAQTRDFLGALGGIGDQKVFKYFPADITIDGRTIKNVGVRKKGFLGSLDNVRPSLKIKFDEFQDQDVAVGFDRLTLNNNKQDPSCLRQVLSYQFFNDTGTAAPRCNFAKVTVNGKPLGIYSNVESIGAEFLEEHFHDRKGALYEGTTTDFVGENVRRLEAKNKAARHDDVTRLAKLLEQETITLGELAPLLDVPAFVRFWATETLLGFWDGYTQNQNNYFVYRSSADNKMRFIPWGMDASYSASIPLPNLKTANKSVYANSILANRLYRLPEVQTLYRETMQRLLAEHWKEDVLTARIDELAELVRQQLPAEDPAFGRRVTEIKQFVQDRRAMIEKELQAWPVEIKHGARRPITSQRIGAAVGTFATKWTERTPAAPADSGQAELKIELNGEQLEFTKLGVVSEPSQDKSNREADGRAPPTVAFHGVRKSDQKQWLLVISTTTDAFRPSTTPVPVGGIIIEGNPLWFFAKMVLNPGNFNDLVLVSGTATFDEAARAPDAPVRGRVKLDIGRFQGGDFLPVR